MTTINVRLAMTHLSRLLDRVGLGEEVAISRAGRPAARLVPAEPALEPRRPGPARGLGCVGDDFDAPMDEEFLAAFR